MLLMFLNAGIVYVDSEEVTKNTLVPGLTVFRVLNQQDSRDRLHHGYELVYTGDVQLAAQGSLSCTLISPTAAEVVMPACSDVFLLNFRALQRAAEGKLTNAEMGPLPSAINKMVKNPELRKIKVLVLFDKTGEELTNGVFSGSVEQLGIVKPKTLIISDDFEEAGGAFERTTLFVTFFIPRVEAEERMAKVGVPLSSNLVGDALADHVQGMGMGDNE
jgi:hypothetical protein